MSIAYMILDFRKTQTILEIKESTETVLFDTYYFFGVPIIKTLFWFSRSAHLKIGNNWTIQLHFVKFSFSEKATKILRNLPHSFDVY